VYPGCIAGQKQDLSDLQRADEGGRYSAESTDRRPRRKLDYGQVRIPEREYRHGHVTDRGLSLLIHCRPELVDWTTKRLKRNRSADTQPPAISSSKRDRKRSTITDSPSISRSSIKPPPRPIEVVNLLDDSEEEEEKQVARVVGRGLRSSSDRAGSGEFEVEDQVLRTGTSSDGDPEESRYRPGRGGRAGDLINRPVCGGTVLTTDINTHLDRKCSTAKDTPGSSRSGSRSARQTTKASWEKLFAGATNPKASTTTGHNEGEEVKRIAKPNYHLASQKELRGICENYGLSTQGDKGVLSERLQIWISIFK
jgi:hypothetical protein